MPEHHARLSPSASSIWMNCPGAIPLIERLGLRGTSTNIFADMGTAMHWVAEQCLSQNIPVSSFKVGSKIQISETTSVTYTADMVPIVTMFVDYVRSLPENAFKMYEQKVEPFPEHQMFGTADTIAAYIDDEDEMVLEIVDLKSGRTPVDVVKNSQLMIYAIGAYRQMGSLLGITQIKITIVQPLIGNPQSYTFDVDELLDFEEEVLAAIRRVRQEPNTYIPSEKACRWCEARHVCPAQHKLINELAAEDFKNLTTTRTPDLGELYRKAQIVKIAIKAIEEESLRRLVAGQSVKGYRLAPGSTRRAWGNTSALIEDMTILVGKKAILSDPELLSPAQLEKVLKEMGLDMDLTPYLEEKTPPPSIVEETSNKPRWSSADSAKVDFALFTNND